MRMMSIDASRVQLAMTNRSREMFLSLREAKISPLSCKMISSRSLLCLLALSSHAVTGEALVRPGQFRNKLQPLHRKGASRRLPSEAARLPDAAAHAPSAVTTLRGGSVLSLSPEAMRLAETFAPKLGIFTSTALYFAPAAAVLSALKADDIGELNPLPLAIMSVVSVAWLAYGLSVRDPNVALSNIFGCFGSIGYVLGLLPLLQKKKGLLRMTQSVVLAGASASLTLWTVLGLSGASAAKMSSSLGLFACALTIVLFGSPLSSIKTVLSTRDSSSILGPLTIAQVINTALWTTYGLAVKDWFVGVPNGVGLVLGFAQLGLKILFPAKKAIPTAVPA
jgi:solute carrier family 50 protein (sugar transporter)